MQAFNFDTEAPPDLVLSVAGLTTYLQDLLEQDPQLQQVWVTGEVSSCNPHRSGIFFTLQDPDEAATIQCVVWKSQLDQLVEIPQAGAQVMVLGRVRLYPARGTYQLTIWQVLPAGEGLRALRYRQLRDRLQTEGLFAPELKRSLPTYPQTIAVVTSAQAAAWGDIQRTLRQRYPGLRVLLSPAIVQGEQAPDSIAQAICRIERDRRAELIILARGGGATEDLECFNDERVVRAVADCTLPLITGIGHQRDESLADLAADVAAHTPTAAAEQAVPRLIDLVADHAYRVARIQQIFDICFQQQGQRLEGLRDRLRRLRLEQQLEHHRQLLDWRRQQLVQTVSVRMQREQQRCQALQQTLLSLDPNAVLQRGYAVVRQESGNIVRSPADVQPGDRLQLQLADGEVQVQVIASQPPDSD
ncbi:MAG: exodeoxyribonuclease VII large subunit [Cyanobacteria bacterium J06638_22]